MRCLFPLLLAASTGCGASDIQPVANDGGLSDVGASPFDEGRSPFQAADHCRTLAPGDHQGAMQKADQHARATVSDAGDLSTLRPNSLRPIDAMIKRKTTAPGVGFVQVVTLVGNAALTTPYYHEPSTEALTDDTKLPTIAGSEVFAGLSGEIEACCRAFLTAHAEGNVQERLEQLLGLVHPANKVGFIALWVDPNDLLRPCPDPSTGTVSCDDGPLKDVVSPQRFQHPGFDAGFPSWYRSWVGKTFDTYEAEGYGDAGLSKYYPFTGLGYSYDWANATSRPYGTSEYVVLKGSRYVYDGPVRGFRTTADYCRP